MTAGSGDGGLGDGGLRNGRLGDGGGVSGGRRLVLRLPPHLRDYFALASFDF